MGLGETRSGLAAVEYGQSASALLLTDREEAAAAWARAGALAGCRISDMASLEAGAVRIGQQVAPDLIIVDVHSDEAGTLPSLLDAIEAVIEARSSCSAVVSASAPLLDQLGLPLESRIHHLVDADDALRVATLALAATRPPLMLNDVNKGQATARLQQLSEEVGRIASILAALSEDEAAAAAVAGLDCPNGAGDASRVEAAHIRAIIRARRLRDHFFKSELFADPAWDMLLDLMAARLEKQRVAVSSLCIAAAVPPTTALRWIKALCDQGLFARVADPEDGRRVFIELADSTAAAMENYLKAASRIAPTVL